MLPICKRFRKFHHRIECCRLVGMAVAVSAADRLAKLRLAFADLNAEYLASLIDVWRKNHRLLCRLIDKADDEGCTSAFELEDSIESSLFDYLRLENLGAIQSLPVVDADSLKRSLLYALIERDAKEDHYDDIGGFLDMVNASSVGAGGEMSNGEKVATLFTDTSLARLNGVGVAEWMEQNLVWE